MGISRWIGAVALSGVFYASTHGRAFAQAVPSAMPAADARSATDAKPKGPVRVSGGVISGMSVNTPSPQYPAAARATGVKGPVVLHAIIGKDGHVKNLVVIAGAPLLRQAALDAVGHWKYRPYLLNGQAVEVDTTIMVNFQ